MTSKLADYMYSLLPKTILAYQFIEEMLRAIIVDYHRIVSLKLEQEIDYNPPYSDIKKASLGSLVRQFMVFNKDENILNILNNVTSKRNEVAHQGYVISVEEQIDDSFIEIKYKELERCLKQANQCIEILEKEAARLESIGSRVYKEIQSKKIINHNPVFTGST